MVAPISEKERQKKEREGLFVDVLLGSENVPGLKGLARDKDREQLPVKNQMPDFSLKGKGREVGLEVEELFRDRTKKGSAHKIQEQLHRRLAKETEKAWGARPFVQVTLHFNERVPLRDGRPIADLAKELVTLAEARLPKEGEISTYQPGLDRNLPKVDPIRAIRQIIIRRLEGIDKTSWKSCEGAWIHTLEPTQLQEEIDKKNAKEPDYRELFREVWLVLGMDGFLLSGSLEASPRAIEHEFSSPFNRVFLVDRSGKRSIELKIKS